MLSRYMTNEPTWPKKRKQVWSNYGPVEGAVRFGGTERSKVGSLGASDIGAFATAGLRVTMHSKKVPNVALAALCPIRVHTLST